jgi:hypothetical protein
MNVTFLLSVIMMMFMTTQGRLLALYSTSASQDSPSESGSSKSSSSSRSESSSSKSTSASVKSLRSKPSTTTSVSSVASLLSIQQRLRHRRLKEKQVTRAQAERACRKVDRDDRDFCIEDILENNDLEMASMYT